MLNFRRIAGIAIALAATQPVLAAPLYKITYSVTLGAPEKWDYLSFDPSQQRIYIAHGTGISVVDATTLKPAGTLPGIQGAHGVLVIAGHGYASNGKSATVTVFDPKTLTAEKSLTAEPDTDGLVYDPASKSLYAINGDSGSLTVINTRSRTVKATIKAGGSLEFGAADGRGHVFINETDPGHILRINTATNAVTDRWEIPGCTHPTGFAVDPASHRIFASCQNAVMLALDSDTGRLVATLPIGHHTDAAAYDPQRHRVFSSNGEGTLSVFAEKTPDIFAKLGDTPTAPGARTMALDTKTGRIFLATADIAHIGPPKQPGGRPEITYKPGSVKLLTLDPTP